MVEEFFFHPLTRAIMLGHEKEKKKTRTERKMHGEEEEDNDLEDI